MADVSFTTGPSSSLFWQGGALCRLRCTNTKLFVQRENKVCPSLLSPVRLFTQPTCIGFHLIHNAEANLGDTNKSSV